MSALTDVFTNIANAIRAKKGVSTTYKPSQMADAINSIPTGPTSTVLWTNPNTSAAFTGQTINIRQRIPIKSYLKVTIKDWMGDDDSQVDKQYPDMLYTGNTVMSTPGIIKGVSNGTDTVSFTRFIYFHPGDTSSSGLKIEISNLYAYRRTDGTIPHNANNEFYIPIKIELITNI